MSIIRELLLVVTICSVPALFLTGVSVYFSETKRKRHYKIDLAESFSDVKLHQQGKKKLKYAKDLLNEL